MALLTKEQKAELLALLSALKTGHFIAWDGRTIRTLSDPQQTNTVSNQPRALSGFFPVLVKKKTGTNSYPPDYAYDVYRLGDSGYSNALNGTVALTPGWSLPRLMGAKGNAAPDGSIGYAYYDENGVLKLDFVRESTGKTVCPTGSP